MYTEVTLMRHGETEANIAGIFCGTLDSPLTKAGLDSAKSLQGKLPQYNAYFTSDLIRAKDTMEAIFPGIHYNATDILREVGLGSWEGLIKKNDEFHGGVNQELRKKFKEGTYTPPGAESREEVIKRIKIFFNMVFIHYEDAKIFAVTSNGFIRTVCQMLAITPPTGNLECITLNEMQIEMLLNY